MVEQTQVQRVESILKRIRELKGEDEKAAKATGKHFNVFSVPGFGYNELDHSAFFANLLNPEGTHSQGVVFLRHFLKQLDSFACENLEGFKVTREAYVGDYGQIDILLEKDDACIIIENKIKINPKDEDRQLNRYYTYAKEKGLQDEQIKLIYLTPDGRKPCKISLSSEDCQRYLDIKLLILMSYKSHILKWMEDCLKEVAKTAPIREVLFQYQALVKGLSGQPINKELTMKISDILIKNYDLIPELDGSISEAKERIPYEFFEKLKEKIAEVCGFERWENMEGVPTARLPISELDPPFTMELQVEIEKGGEDKGYLWYGFIVPKNGQISECDESHLKKYLDLAGEEFETRTDIALIYKWPKYENQYISFSDFGTEQMRYIVEDEDNMIETIAQEIKDVVDKFIKAKEVADL